MHSLIRVIELIVLFKQIRKYFGVKICSIYSLLSRLIKICDGIVISYARKRENACANQHRS